MTYPTIICFVSPFRVLSLHWYNESTFRWWCCHYVQPILWSIQRHLLHPVLVLPRWLWVHTCSHTAHSMTYPTIIFFFSLFRVLSVHWHNESTFRWWCRHHIQSILWSIQQCLLRPVLVLPRWLWVHNAPYQTIGGVLRTPLDLPCQHGGWVEVREWHCDREWCAGEKV